MNKKNYPMAAGSVFLLGAGVHLVRVVTGSQLTLGDWVIPMWLSWIAFPVASYMAYVGLSQNSKKK